jgi:ferredoxin
MHLQSVKLVCFSPTGTTQAVVRAIAGGLEPSTVQTIDITHPSTRQQPLTTRADELLVVGVPVYMGRVPALLNEWLNSIEAHDTPTVCVVVYGNRAYENALLELKDILTRRGCVPVAGAAYIGEHSFADSTAPVALGRPDERDLNHARAFGQAIREKLQAIPVASRMPEVHLPGSSPYGGITKLWDVDFIAVGEGCTHCGACAEACPVGAIDSQDSAVIDHEKCITCCACIKTCPQNARTMKPGPVKDAQTRLITLYRDPKAPECFL